MFISVKPTHLAPGPEGPRELFELVEFSDDRITRSGRRRVRNAERGLRENTRGALGAERVAFGWPSLTRISKGWVERKAGEESEDADEG